MKPRCNVCNGAMKSPYERVGAKGSWNSINDWWFCSSCNRMECLPDIQISVDTSEYLDKDMADKFPKIARFRSHTETPIIDLQELNEEIKLFSQRSKYFPMYTRLPINEYQFHDRNQTYTYNEGVWLCSICLEFKELTPEEINELESSDTLVQIPIHCETPMRLTSVSRDLVMQKFNSTKNDLLNNPANLETAMSFLQYMLSLLSNHYFRKLVNDFSEISVVSPRLQETMEFNLVHHLLSIFRIYTLPLEFHLISTSELNHLRFSLAGFSDAEKEHISSLRLSIFQDLKTMILKLQSVPSESIFDLYRPLWVIETIILAGKSNSPIPDFSPPGIKKKPSLFKSYNEVINLGNDLIR